MLKRFPQFEIFGIGDQSRTPEACERHGCDYHFMTHEEFMRAVAENRFVEWEEVYQGTCYGTLRSEVERIWAKGNIIVFDVDVIGGINLKRIFGDDACSIFVMPPSIGELRRRLVCRGTDAPEVIDRRVAKAEFELTKAPRIRPHRRKRLARRGDPRNDRDHRPIHRTAAMKRVMLYFGSFNPIHKGHIALAEYAVEKGLCDELVLVVSPQSPYNRPKSWPPRWIGSKWPRRPARHRAIPTG